MGIVEEIKLHPKYRYGSNEQKNVTRGTFVHEKHCREIKKYLLVELYNEYNRLDYSGFKEEIAAATCHHFVFGFCDKKGHDEGVEKHIPKPLKEYIYDSICNIRTDFANQTYNSDLTDDEKH